ncbi:serine hydrolase domain-containing protein [Bowdeniella nasicola]|nr:serine hydrolase domain-containing protein [Bowdeniella nasicola]
MMLTSTDVLPCAPLLGEWSFDCGLVVVDRGGVIHTEGSVNTVFPFASVTKPLAVYAALIAVDRHMFDLDAPAGPRAPEGATIRHLMAHASGLPFEAGYASQRPERHRVYSNVGIEIMGEQFEEATGVDIQTWTDEQVLTPLGVVDVEFDGSPAWGAKGSARCLAEIVREWLNPTLVSPEIFREATSTQFAGLDGVVPSYGRHKENAWGLGFEIHGQKDPHWMSTLHSPKAFGHFGRSGSFVWVDPDLGLAAVFLGEKPYDEEHHAKWTDLNGRIVACYRKNGR